MSRERRRYPRLPLTAAVLVELLGDKVGEQLARTQDLSVGGCMFTSPRSYPSGSIIQLLVKVGSDVVEAVARVVYVTPRGRSGYDIGAEFIFIKDEYREHIAGLLRTSQPKAPDR